MHGPLHLRRCFAELFNLLLHATFSSHTAAVHYRHLQPGPVLDQILLHPHGTDQVRPVHHALSKTWSGA